MATSEINYAGQLPIARWASQEQDENHLTRQEPTHTSRPRARHGLTMLLLQGHLVRMQYRSTYERHAERPGGLTWLG
jgi:hypothetical protein